MSFITKQQYTSLILPIGLGSIDTVPAPDLPVDQGYALIFQDDVLVENLTGSGMQIHLDDNCNFKGEEGGVLCLMRIADRWIETARTTMQDMPGAIPRIGYLTRNEDGTVSFEAGVNPGDGVIMSQLTTELSGYVPTSRTVNDKPLIVDIEITKADVDLDQVPNIDATNPSNITQDSTHRFVTDAEKTTWNAKQAALVSGTNIKTINSNSLLGSGDISVSTLIGYTPYNGSTNPNSYITTAGARTAISLTTTGSGAATYNNSTGILNIPIGGSGTVTSVGLTSTDFSVSGSPVTTSGNITANLNTSGVVAGTYRGAYTVNSKGIITTAIDPTVNNTVARSLSNAAGSTNRYTISATQPAFVTYSITMNFTITALAASSASVFLEYSMNAGSTWVTVSQVNTSFNLGLALSGSNDMSLSGYLPANALVRLRPATTNATCTYQLGQEILY